MKPGFGKRHLCRSVLLLATVGCGRNAVSPSITNRSPAPTRDPNTPGFVTAKELPDGTVPPVDADGSFIIRPTHTPALEIGVREGVPRGAAHALPLISAASRISPGL